jgi:hypothetical protein
MPGIATPSLHIAAPTVNLGSQGQMGANHTSGVVQTIEQHSDEYLLD